MLNVQLVGDKELVARLTSSSGRVRDELRKEVHKQTLGLEAYIKTSKLSGTVLKVRTGDLRASIHSTFEETGSEIKGKVSSSGDVKYAAIHEFGGTIRHPGGTPYTMTDSGPRFVSKARAAEFKKPLPVTKPHDIHMPQRSFMRSGLADRRDKIVAGLQAAAAKGAGL